MNVDDRVPAVFSFSFFVLPFNRQHWAQLLASIESVSMFYLSRWKHGGPSEEAKRVVGETIRTACRGATSMKQVPDQCWFNQNDE